MIWKSVPADNQRFDAKPSHTQMMILFALGLKRKASAVLHCDSHAHPHISVNGIFMWPRVFMICNPCTCGCVRACVRVCVCVARIQSKPAADLVFQAIPTKNDDGTDWTDMYWTCSCSSTAIACVVCAQAIQAHVCVWRAHVCGHTDTRVCMMVFERVSVRSASGAERVCEWETSLNRVLIL